MDQFNFFHPSAFTISERLAPQDCAEQRKILMQMDQNVSIFDFFPDFILVLNKYRQILFSNRAINTFLAVNGEQLVGMRPGEALHCTHAGNDSGGCGTTEFCRVCGAVHSILMALNDKTPSLRECEILTLEGSALNLRIWTFPFNCKEDGFVLCILRDIADEKYRHFLEHIFFHDLTNIGAGIYNLLSLIGNDVGKYSEYSGMLLCLAKEILNEIEAQRDLLDAESGSIAIDIDTIPALYLLRSVKTLFLGNPTAEGKMILIPEDLAELSFRSDPRLLTRVIGNMVKNALEASKPGEQVELDYRREKDHIIFSVHNPGAMGKEIQLQVFKRAFSSKGKGRGLGTYSMRLLTERYLKGTVYFTSTPEEGTTFYVALPLALEGE